MILLNFKIYNRLFFPAKQCRDRWNKLRDNFRKALSNRKGKSGDGANPTKLIKFEKELSFITPFIRDRNQISNITLSSDDSQPGTPQPPPLPPPSTPSNSEVESLPSTSGSNKRPHSDKDVATVFQEYLERKSQARGNSLRNFFISMSMSDTVEAFPKEVQARIKRRVFNIVNEAELCLYGNDDLSYSLLINSPPSSNQSSNYQPLSSSNQPIYQPLSSETYTSENYSDQGTYGYNTRTQNRINHRYTSKFCGITHI